MNKQNLKTSMIALVAIGIIVAVIVFTKGLQYVSKPISPYDLTNHIEKVAQKNMSEKDIDKAHKTYVSLLREIKTDASIKQADGQWSLTSSEVDDALLTLFSEYAPVVAKVGNVYFERSSWDEKTVLSLHNDATWLKKMDYAEKQSDLSNDLDAIIKHGSNYKAALQVVRSAKSCASVAEVKEVKKKADNYAKLSPLTNNTSLVSELKSAEKTALSSLVSNIITFCNGVAGKWRAYGSYVKWYAAYENACQRISDYGKTYGQNASLQKAKASLDNADKNALNYYN